MGSAAPRPQIDERALVAGTTVRFAMLVVLLLAASGAMMLPVIRSLRTTDSLGCNLAAGLDPNRVGDLASVLNALDQAVAYRACIAKYAPPPPQWEIYGWPVLLSVAAVLLFLLLPVWKTRRSRAVPLDSVDGDGQLRVLLTDLAQTAGLSRLPRVVVDQAAVSTGAVVYGRNRRPIMCLHGGLLACRNSDPERFRAVLLHEFAHIAGRDITVTYSTVVLWRVFLALVLVPYLVWETTVVYGTFTWWRPSYALTLIRGVLLPGLTVALVYLARSDVLRSREVYADLAAVRWGADPHGWDVTTRAPAGGRFRRALGSLREHWGTHPRWEERRGALADPAPLFGSRALPMFLTGVAATMVNTYLLSYLSTYELYSLWRVQLVSLAPAVLVSGVIGTVLWRRVAYAVLRGNPVPSGARVGLWLGSGMGVGGLLIGYGMGGSEWLPARPALLLLPVAAGVAFAWWVTQCAHLWARTWRGRSLRPPLLIGLVSATLVLSAWFAWWTMDGSSWAAGASYDSTDMRLNVLRLLHGSDAAQLDQVSAGADMAHSAVVSAVAAVLPVLYGFVATPLIPAAIAALWVVPLAAWATGRAAGTPRWVASALSGSGDPVAPVAEPIPEPVPPLRRALGPGLLGGAVCWLALVGVRAYLHTSQPGPLELSGQGLYEVRYLAWLFGAMVGSTAVAAVVAASTIGRGRTLIGTLIAAETAALLGIAGMVLLVSADGCVGPLNTLKSACGWHPAWELLRGALPVLINSTLALAAIIALLVAAAGSLCRRWRPQQPGSAREVAVERTRPGGRAVGARRFPVRLVVAVCAAAALGIAAVEPIFLAKLHSTVPDSVTTQQITRQGAHVPAVPVSADTRASQVHAWHRLGGRYLLEHATADFNHIRSVLRSAVDTKNARLPHLARVRPTCADFGRIADWVHGAYFRVPDPKAQSAWQALGTQAHQGSQNCERALDQQDTELFVTAMGELIAAGNSAATVTRRVKSVLHEAGYAGY